MMPIERDTLEAIAADPDDDFPRLVHADELCDSSDPADRVRGEFIRLQIMSAALPVDHPERPALLESENNLRLRHQAEWTEQLKGLASGFEFRRGFVEAATMTVPQFAAGGAKLFDLVPLRRVRFVQVGSRVEQLAKHPLLERLKELVFCGSDLSPDGLRHLLRSPHLSGCESLDLSFNGLDDAAVQLIANAGTLPNLRTLLLNDSGRITGAGVTRLSQSATLPELRHLDLSANAVDGRGLKALLESKSLPKLEILRLRANAVGDAGAVALSESPRLAAMLTADPQLDLRQNRIGDAGVDALAKSAFVEGIESLELSSNALGDAAAVAIAGRRIPWKLRDLFLGHNRLTDSGALAIARSALMKQLSRIDVSSNRLTRRGIDELWHHRRDWTVAIDCEGNVPGVSGPSGKVRTHRSVVS